MTWIEDLLGISPDGGTGSLEWLLVVVPLVLILLMLMWQRSR